MLTKIEERMHFFLNSRWSSLVYTVCASLAVIFSLEHYAIPVFVLWMAFTAVMEKNFLNIFLPLVLVCGIVLRTLRQTVLNTEHFWLTVPVLIAIVLHLVLHKRHFRRGKLLYSYLAVSAALIFGGLFHISAANYFRLEMVYYVFFLGLGVTFLYVWFRSGVYSSRHYDCRERLMECLYCVGIFCSVSILEQAVRLFLTTGNAMQSYLWANDIADMMLFAIPAAFYFARRNYIHAFVGMVFYAMILFTVSLSAIFVGALLLLCCFGYLLRYRVTLRMITVSAMACIFACGMAVAIYLVKRAGGVLAFVTAEDSGRLGLIREAWQNFLSAPVFGVGMGDPGGMVDANFMIINWTHNFVFQVLGSMGIVGVLAYGYQMYARTSLVFARRDPFHMAVGLLYLALFLISLLQPGEFCPMPYALISVMVFTVLEVSDEEKQKKAGNDEKTVGSS